MKQTVNEQNKVKYLEGIGRRKTAVARVRIMKGTPSIIINNKKLEEYFPILNHQEKVLQPLKLTNTENKFAISVKVKGSGLNAQAEAIRLGLARVLILINKEYKEILRNHKLLTRDNRQVERKKYGLKKARRAPQWQKR
ncbi:MAG: 30S ribosomal protein S9 [Minisyncoccia bacterium]